MFRVQENTTVATVTDLSHRTNELMARVGAGEIVVVQEDNEPRGVYLSYRHYESMLDAIDRLENLELALAAVPRHEAVARGEMGTMSLGEMIAEFAPELRDLSGA